MLSPEFIKNQINVVVKYLVEIGLADDQNFALRRDSSKGQINITFPQSEHISVALKDRDYIKIYKHLAAERAYNAKMPDGALIQMMYEFQKSRLRRHRLSFFPAPHLEDFQNNPEIYLNDEIYADIIAKNIVPFPIRFDFDVNSKLMVHPKSHLTLGQYENCRIPVTAPLTPFRFIEFLLRNFYHNAFNRYADRLSCAKGSFKETILLKERSVIHLTIP